MKKRQRILVPVDLDEGSRSALKYALSLAKDIGAEVDVIHVWEPPRLVRPDLMVYLESSNRALSLAEFTQNQAREDLARLIQEVTSEHHAVKALVVMGNAAKTIVETAKQGNHDMIVMATHGRRGLPHALLGSVAEKVVRSATCPVVVVPINAAAAPAQ